ncbi:MAG TPA: endolytic transglycosylase MltG [Vicinamibacterales bacterium]
MKKLVLAVMVLALAAGAVGYYAVRRLNEPFQGYQSAEQFVEIPSGANTRTIGDALIANGIIRDETTYRLALWRSGEARRLQAGEYRFDHPMTPGDVLGKIARGEVYRVAITFPEGLTIAEMAKIFEAHGLGTAASFTAAANNPALAKSFDPAARDLEGYIFPDTYNVPRRTDATALVHLMVERFEKVLTPELRQTAAERGLNVRQLVTLASIVEKETAQPGERPEVAAVYTNRLKRGMALQCDPTVIYALERTGKYDGNIRKDDLMFDSPYNTYRYPGLPPGPIAAPGKASMEAAAHPSGDDYLYFVSRNDGSHAFARTLDEHNRNVQQFQIQYFRARRAAERH